MGTSANGHKCYSSVKDHPHACGDKYLLVTFTSAMRGSSPRVWGQVCGDTLSTVISEDHPHACGDKLKGCQAQAQHEGSSPRVWGQGICADSLFGRQGIIPTRVGTRPKPAVTDTLNGDHPHACGDKLFAKLVIAPLGGSSPRVWGQASDGVSFDNCNRIIPTRVGTSGFSDPLTSSGRDHPHACGDKYKSTLWRSFGLGSSPRVWGQAMRATVTTAQMRIIPTRVGTRVR